MLTVIFILGAIFLFLAMLPRRTRFVGQEPAGQIEQPNELGERRISPVVISAVIASIVVLFVLLFIDFFTGRSIYALNDQNTAEPIPHDQDHGPSMVVAG